ncbi:MAG: 5'-methylthioadenosine/adenosylhomocysteine nucleosidase [Spirochaetaceae bacterium]|nr:5'-methylthioadenosine/adenosylhomocysteine nucleosidase [Spirochaetaceae bacterium]
MIKVGIIGAMDVEVEGFCHHMTGVILHQLCGLDFLEGFLAETPVVVVRSGVGKVNAALCAQMLITKFRISHLINTGVAGALAKGLNVLDLVISTEVMYHDVDATNWGYESCTVPGMDRTFVADKNLITIAAGVCKKLFPEKKIVKGLIASGDQFIGSTELKNKIKSLCNPACVEMEGAAIGHVAAVNKIPFVVIRCMSDMADDNGEETARFNEKEGGTISSQAVYGIVQELGSQ